MEELAGLDMFDGIRAAPPDPTGEPGQCGVITSHGTVENTLCWAIGTTICRRPCTITTYLVRYASCVEVEECTV